MFIERMMSQDSAPALEQVIRFTSARHRLIAENIANVDTPGFRQKDLSVKRFHETLRRSLESRDRSGVARFEGMDQEVMHPIRGILFHDRNNRSMEQLATDLAKNAMMHNIAVELLRKQYEQMTMALRERIM